MKQSLVWILAFLMICGSLGFSSISLAGEEEWRKKTDMPTARVSFSTASVKNKIYAIGGWTGPGGLVLSTVEEYDPMINKWTKKADMPTARYGLSTSAVNGKIYAIGGRKPTVEEYDTGLGIKAIGKLVTSWSKIKTTKLSSKQ